MDKAIFETTLLLGSLKEKQNLLFSKKTPEFYVAQLLIDMLAFPDWNQPQVGSSVKPIDVIFSALGTQIKIPHKIFRQILELTLKKQSASLQIDHLVTHSSMSKEDWIFTLDHYQTEINKNPTVLIHNSVVFFMESLYERYPDLSHSKLIPIFQSNIIKIYKFNFLIEIKEMLDNKKLFNKEHSKIIDSLCINQIKACSTKELVGAYQNYTRYTSLSDPYVKLIKEILNEREHIETKSQKTLIRKMSARVKKKLSLREAQLLNNKLKRSNK